MRTHSKVAFLATLVWALGVVGSPEAAAAEPRLAVLALHDRAELGAEAAAYLTDLVRQQVLKWPVPELVVMTRENLAALLPPGTDLAECVGDCEVETARRIGAELVVTGEVVRFDGGLRATLRLHEATSAKLVGAETAPALNPGALEVALRTAAGALGARLAGDRRGPAVVYRPATLPTVPRVRPSPDPAARTVKPGLSLRDVDVEALELYERALEMEGRAGASDAQRSAAWQALAARPSAYQALAKGRAAAWAKRAEDERAAEAARAERRRLVEADWARIERLSRLRVVSDADKQRWLGEFIQAFGDDPAQRDLVLRAKTLRTKLTKEAGQYAWLALPGRVGQVVKLTMIGGGVRRGRLIGFDGTHAYLKRGSEIAKISAAVIQRCD